jgi:hypothetical protein
MGTPIKELEINSFGIETELSKAYNIHYLEDAPNNVYLPLNGGSEFKVCKDLEYYNSQIEFKFFPAPIEKFTR